MKKINIIFTIILIGLIGFGVNINSMIEPIFIDAADITNGDEVNPRVENIILRPTQENVTDLEEKPVLEDKDLSIDDVKLREKYFCVKCYKNLSTIGNLKNHINAVHEKIKKHKCDTCEATFGDGSSLRYHKFKIHNQEAGYTCTQEGCDRKFLYQTALANHVNGHFDGTNIETNNKNISCIKSGCRKSFVTIGGLKRHINTVHEKIKKYKCDICELTFGDGTGLKYHKFSKHNKRADENTIFACTKEGCKREFICQSALRVHLRTHNKHNSLTCKFCNITFNQESDCKEHEESCKKREFSEIQDAQDIISNNNKKNKKS